MFTKYDDIGKNPQVIELLRSAVAEDSGSGDYSSLACIEKDKIASARLIFKDRGIAAGLCVAYALLKMDDAACEIHPLKSDGDAVEPGDIGFEVRGNARNLMKCERVLLNIIQRLSGISTVTHQAVNQIKNYKTKILDTRKTTPNLRMLEKWAVVVGGGYNHRFGLFDMIMLKDNHIDLSGGIVPAVQKARQFLEQNRIQLGIEVETRNLNEVKQVLEVLPVQRIMLDNFKPEICAEAVKLIAGRTETEASGGIDLRNIEAYAATGVDFISLGMITHSVKSLDISFKIK